MTWTLCSIPNPLAALKEIKRALKQDGLLIFVDHARAPAQKWEMAGPAYSRVEAHRGRLSSQLKD
jgi:SAM-dependent methyltransferase